MPDGIARDDIQAGAIIPSKLGTEMKYFSKLINVGQIAHLHGNRSQTINVGQVANADGNKSLPVNVGDVAADSDAIKVPVWKPTKNSTIKRIQIGFDTAVTAADTDYQTVAITDGTNTIASTTTGPASGGDSYTAGVFVELTIDTDYDDISTSEQVYVEFTKTGNGMALSGMAIQIDYVESDVVKFPVLKPTKAMTVSRVQFGVPEAITAQDTNYATIKLTDGTNTIASLATGPASGGQSFTAGVLVEATIDTDYAAITAAEQLYIEVARTGEGMQIEGITCQIDYIENDSLKFPVMKPKSNITINKVQFGCAHAITAADTNYLTFALTDGTNTIASIATGPAASGTSLTEGVLAEATLDADYVAVTTSEQLYVEITRTGDGMQVDGLTCQIDYEVDDPS